MKESRNAFKILTGKLTGNRPLGRPRRRWEDDIRMNLEEIGINAGNWVDSAQDRDYWRALVNAALNLRVSISHGLSLGIFLGSYTVQIRWLADASSRNNAISIWIIQSQILTSLITL